MELEYQSDIITGILLAEKAMRALGSIGIVASGDMEQDFISAFSRDLITFPDVQAEREAFAMITALSECSTVSSDIEQHASSNSNILVASEAC